MSAHRYDMLDNTESERIHDSIIALLNYVNDDEDTAVRTSDVRAEFGSELVNGEIDAGRLRPINGGRNLVLTSKGIDYLCKWDR